MPVSLSILGSGSGGNAAVIATPTTRILIDAGFSRRELRRRLALAGHSPHAITPDAGLDAVLITHEHSDHVAGLPRLAASAPFPVYINEGTQAALGPAGAALPRVERFVTGQSFAIGDIEITPFTIPHDASDPVGFRFRAQGVAIVFVTDLGYLAANVLDQLRGADCLVIESNHDLEMLKAGGYPWALKQRVLSRLGHLSNDTLAAYLAADFDRAAAHLVLAHLSENNNLPELARLSAQRALAARSASTQIHVAPQAEPLPTLDF